MTQETIGNALDFLFTQLNEKKGDDPTKSYSASLIQGDTSHCAKKLGEEAVELSIALALKDKTAIKNEAADLLFHFTAAMINSDIAPHEIAEVLAKRRGIGGLEEKANRKK